jgi:hypothetical protein
VLCAAAAGAAAAGAAHDPATDDRATDDRAANNRAANNRAADDRAADDRAADDRAAHDRAANDDTITDADADADADAERDLHGAGLRYLCRAHYGHNGAVGNIPVPQHRDLHRREEPRLQPSEPIGELGVDRRESRVASRPDLRRPPSPMHDGVQRVHDRFRHRVLTRHGGSRRRRVSGKPAGHRSRLGDLL